MTRTHRPTHANVDHTRSSGDPHGRRPPDLSGRLAGGLGPHLDRRRGQRIPLPDLPHRFLRATPPGRSPKAAAWTPTRGGRRMARGWPSCRRSRRQQPTVDRTDRADPPDPSDPPGAPSSACWTWPAGRPQPSPHCATEFSSRPGPRTGRPSPSPLASTLTRGWLRAATRTIARQTTPTSATTATCWWCAGGNGRWTARAISARCGGPWPASRWGLGRRAGSRSSPKLLAVGDFDLLSPTWSPDGACLAVVGNLDEDADATRRQFVYLLDPRAAEPAPPRKLGEPGGHPPPRAGLGAGRPHDRRGGARRPAARPLRRPTPVAAGSARRRSPLRDGAFHGHPGQRRLHGRGPVRG